MTGGTRSSRAPFIAKSDYPYYPSECISRRLVRFPLRSRATLNLLLFEKRDIRQHHLALNVIERRTGLWFRRAPLKVREWDYNCVARRRSVSDQRSIIAKRHECGALGFGLSAMG
jgi:hypothetical protein